MKLGKQGLSFIELVSTLILAVMGIFMVADQVDRKKIEQRKKREGRERQAHLQGEDLRAAVKALRDLEQLRSHQLEEARRLLATRKAQIQTLQAMAGREALVAQHRLALAQLGATIDSLSRDLQKRVVLRITQQMQAHLVLAIRQIPIVADLADVVADPGRLGQLCTDFEAMLGQIDQAMVAAGTLLQTDPAMGILSQDDREGLRAVHAALEDRARAVREEVRLRVDQLGLLHLDHQQAMLGARARTLDQVQVQELSQVLGDTEATARGLEGIRDQIIRQMAEVEVELLSSPDLRTPIQGLDLSAETAAVEEANRRFSALRRKVSI